MEEESVEEAVEAEAESEEEEAEVELESEEDAENEEEVESWEEEEFVEGVVSDDDDDEVWGPSLSKKYSCVTTAVVLSVLLTVNTGKPIWWTTRVIIMIS